MSLKLTVAAIKSIAHKHNWTYVAEPVYGYVGYIQFPNGKKTFFRSHSLETNQTAPMRIARDKDYTKFFLRNEKLSTPRSKVFYRESYNMRLPVKSTIDDGYAFAKSVGFPIILKPNSSAQGMDVYKIYSPEDFMSVAHELFTRHSILLAEEYVEGRDYRLTVYKDKVHAIYERRPLQICGNGKNTIRELLEKVSWEAQQKQGITIAPDYVGNRQVQHVVRQQGRRFADVLSNGETMKVLDNANLSTGGSSVDMTTKAHRYYHDIAIAAAKSIHLDLAGVDIITSDITIPSSYMIIEVNGNPSIENFMRTKEGYKRGYTLYETILLDKYHTS